MAITATVAQNEHPDDLGYVTLKTHIVSMSADIKFQSSCEYNHGDNDQYDWNKLIGFSTSQYSFNSNSARWGWRWDLTNEKVEIAPYVRDGSTIIFPPSSQWIQVDLNDWFNAKIEIDRANSKYIFTYVNGGSPIVHEVSVSGNLNSLYSGAGVSDFFYFGGTKTAPHEMKIDYDNITYTAKPRLSTWWERLQEVLPLQQRKMMEALTVIILR